MAIDRLELCVVLDSCVLFQAPLRDLLLRLALLDVFRARWSNSIHDEWMRSLLVKRPDLSVSRLKRTRDLMNSQICDGLVVKFEHLIPAIHLPDPDDRHVVALAQFCMATHIVTYNLKDFPQAELCKFGIEAVHPDAFLAGLIAGAPTVCCKALTQQRLALQNPPLTTEELLNRFKALSLTRTVEAYRSLLAPL